MTKESLERIDIEGMYVAVRSFPELLREGRRRALQAETHGWPGTGINGVVVAGMGGSAIGGDILSVLAANHATVPIVVSRSYSLPAWVGSNTAVVTSSYSGNTEETLAAFDDACARGARVLAISTGGELAAKAEEQDIPLVNLPAGIQPRAALPHSLSALLTVTEPLQLTDVKPDHWAEAASITDAQSKVMAKVTDPDNPAVVLARALHGYFPVIYSSEQFAAANTRWRNQIHENAKSLAVG
ncbi:MAG: bifunctional phosphoglucose/phosphomannose isomerase, partial [Rhodothermaceae bacterium]|nr:bifunctional phosphoglucose/phosphomannose isomerase [Rhodothermaceae bacterium]